jgi:hypothetical protein
MEETVTSQHILVIMAVTAILAYSVEAPVAHADPSPAGTTVRPKKRAAASVNKPKPAAASKKPPKPSPEVADSKDADKRPNAGAGHEIVEHESRIEFDERMVRGQTAAGAIFLFQRTPSELKSIVEIPTSFREKTVEMLQPLPDTP